MDRSQTGVPGTVGRTDERSWPSGPLVALGIVLVVAAVVRVLWIGVPARLYYDERFYVNAARAILGWPVDAGIWPGIRAGIDPNGEHPPLGKVLIAASMLLFGDGPVGWRLPSLAAGLASLGLVYGIVRSLGGAAWTGVVAVVLLALDVLSFDHSRMAMLDGILVALMLLGAWLALRHRWGLAGAALGGATLVKLSGALGFLGVAAWLAWTALRNRKDGLRTPMISLARLSAAYAAVGIGGLWLLDRGFTTFASPLDHVAAMLGYAVSLSPAAAGIPFQPYTSPPWVWLTGGGQLDYYSFVMLRAIASPSSAAAIPPVIVHATINLVLLGAFPIVLVLCLARVRRAAAHLERWSLAWIGGTYLPWLLVPLVSSRPMFLFYVLPVVPGIAVATAAALGRLPRPVTWAYLCACLAGFMYFYPYKGIP